MKELKDEKNIINKNDKYIKEQTRKSERLIKRKKK